MPHKKKYSDKGRGYTHISISNFKESSNIDVLTLIISYPSNAIGRLELNIIFPLRSILLFIRININK